LLSGNHPRAWRPRSKERSSSLDFQSECWSITKGEVVLVHEVHGQLGFKLRNKSGQVSANLARGEYCYATQDFGWTVVNGYLNGRLISSNVMTITAAKRKFADLPKCGGFCLKGPVTDGTVEIYFMEGRTVTSDWQSDSTWTSFLPWSQDIKHDVFIDWWHTQQAKGNIGEVLHRLAGQICEPATEELQQLSLEDDAETAHAAFVNDFIYRPLLASSLQALRASVEISYLQISVVL